MIESNNKYRDLPNGLMKIFSFDWPVLFLIVATSSFGFLILYSVADGNLYTWAHPQMVRFSFGLFLIFSFGMININFWKSLSPLIYFISLLLIVLVMFYGDTGNGSQRWLDLKFVRIQPSELMKLALVMLLASYYDWLAPERLSKPIWVILPLFMILIPASLVMIQPDLGTGLLLIFIGLCVMFMAGVSFWYFGFLSGFILVGMYIIWTSRNTSWQIIKDYQYKRIDTFLNPSLDPLGSGYHITQSKIALGSGGLTGRGFMQGTQSQLNFLPEKHTDFIFTTLAEEFGFLGAAGLLVIYGSILLFCTISAITNKNKFGSLLTSGLTVTFFSYFALNIAMVMGLAPVVGVPLPLISYGGSAMIVLMAAFGLMQSAHVHRLRLKK